MTDYSFCTGELISRARRSNG